MTEYIQTVAFKKMYLNNLIYWSLKGTSDRTVINNMHPLNNLCILQPNSM